MSDLAIHSLRPIWLLGCGAGFGLLLILVLWGVAALVRWPAGTAVRDMLLEPVAWPVLLLATLLTLFAVVSAGMDSVGFHIFEQKKDALASILRLGRTGERELNVSVADKEQALAVPISVPAGELNSMQLDSNRDLIVSVNVPNDAKLGDDQRIHVKANEANEWARGNESAGPLAGDVKNLYVFNESGGAATLKIHLATQPIVPQALLIPVVALGLFGYIGLLLLLQLTFPKVAAVSLATAREAMAQPLFYLVLCAGAVLLLALLVTPFFTFGEDVKEYKNGGLTIIMILSIVLAVWTASVSVAEEIEGRTALTVLSKPIGRIQFILGKYFGIVIAVAVVFILLGTMFLMCTSYKVVYDARESGDPNVVWQDCYTDMAQTAPGLVLAFMETSVLASISVAISTRLPMLPNLIICSAIYVIGHLVPLLVQSTIGRFELVRFMGELLATILPNLEHFNIYAAVAAGADVPVSYLGWAGLCSLNYIAIALLLALAMFEDRDLA